MAIEAVGSLFLAKRVPMLSCLRRMLTHAAKSHVLLARVESMSLGHAAKGYSRDVTVHIVTTSRHFRSGVA